MPKSDKKRYPAKKHLRNLSILILGVSIDCVGYLIYLSPNDILAGGVWGVAAIIHHFADVLPMGAYVAILNIPLLIWAWNKLNLRFALYTLFVIGLQTVLLIVLIPYLPTYTVNPLLACIFGGVLCGIGPGLIVKYHGSVGGTDIVGIILHSKYDISVGSISLIIKIVIVTTAGFIFDFELAMYTMVSLFIAATVFNQVLEGINRKRNMMIVTTEGKTIADKLMFDIGRGVTIMKGEGGYTHQERDVLYCVVSRFELPAIKDMVMEIDPNAFVCINESYEVIGKFTKRSTNQNSALGFAVKSPASKQAAIEKKKRKRIDR
jgi:uncharacterized membrane-anchored protein YitT (DUF2179 family)